MKHIDTEIVHTLNGLSIIAIPINSCLNERKFFIAQDRLMLTDHANQEIRSVDLINVMKMMQDNGKTDDVPAVICAICNNDKFQIAYGNYECIAVCQCGNRITVYDG